MFCLWILAMNAAVLFKKGLSAKNHKSVSQTTIQWNHWGPINLYKSPSGTDRLFLKKACFQANIKCQQLLAETQGIVTH